MFNRIEIVGFSLILLLLVCGIALVNIAAFVGSETLFGYGLLFTLLSIPVGHVAMFLVEGYGNE